MGEQRTHPRSRLSPRQGVQVLFVAALGLALTASLAHRGLPQTDVLLGALVTVLATGHVYALLWRENRARLLIAASREVARRARADCERATREKQEFMASVGHELGAPLAAIVGFAEVLRTSDGRAESDAERHEVIDTIVRSGRRLLNMTSDMLDLSRLEAGRLTVQCGECDLPAILAEVETLMRPLAAQRALRFRIDQPGPLPASIHTDPSRLRQILVNIATHALRAADRGEAVVSVSLDRDGRGDGARLRIETLAGRGAGSLERLLGQTGSGASGRFDSVRLGLVIAQRLAELLGGELRVVHPGAGARPTVCATIDTGPLSGTQLLAAPAPPAAAAAAPAPPAAAAPAPLDARILLVDEDGDDQRLIAFHLRHAGAEVEIEAGPREAADRALAAHRAGRPFHLLILDATSEHLAEAGRLRQAGADTLVVAVATPGEGATPDACRDAGCAAHLESPVEHATLIDTCAQAAVRAVAPATRATEAA